jgi:ferredoxin
MIRKIIKIEKEKCNGCGLCVSACHEGAIGLVDGRATLLRVSTATACNCLPVCPTGAISFEERGTAAFDEDKVKQNGAQPSTSHAACPGTCPAPFERPPAVVAPAAPGYCLNASQLNQWPVQIKFVLLRRLFAERHLLIAADCTAFSYGEFHTVYENKVTLIAATREDGGITPKTHRNHAAQRHQKPYCGEQEFPAAAEL